MRQLDRRHALVGAAGITISGIATARLLPQELLLRDRRPLRSRVALISASQYSEGLVDSLKQGIHVFKFDLRGKSVLLKPNLVEYIASVEVNTNPFLVGAAAEALLRLGAKRVVVGEGPGLLQIILDALFNSLEFLRVKTPAVAGEKLNGPLVHEFFGREFFSHAQLRERSVELERRDGRVRMTDEEACVDGATASKNQSRRQAF